MKRWSLRTRLTVLYLCVFGAIQVAVSGVILVAREQYLRRDFDEQILDRATGIAEAVSEQRRRRGMMEASARGVGPVRITTGFALIRDADGDVLDRSANLEGWDLPFEPRGASAHGEWWFETVRRERSGHKRGDLRLVTLYVAEEDMDPFLVQVARETAPLQDSIANLRLLMLLVVPAGLAVAGVASAAMARRSLEPVDRMTRLAQEISAADLSRRLPPPAGGDELSRLAGVLNGMLDRLESAFRAQERFVATASHELKTPLAAVLAEAELLRRQGTDSRRMEAFLWRASEELRRLLRLVDCLLALERADAGVGLSHSTEVDLREILPDAVKACAAQAQNREVRLVLRLPEDAPCVVRGDADLLRIMAENLIRNAVGFSPQNEVVEVCLEGGQDAVTIRVNDRGPGVAPDLATRIFEPYVTSARATGGTGTGLGLTVARGVARLHAGTIEARNLPTGGCSFTVTLPRANATARSA